MFKSISVCIDQHNVENNSLIGTELIKTKIKEAVLIFLDTNPELKNILFDFREPGKIDLEAYMNAVDL